MQTESLSSQKILQPTRTTIILVIAGAMTALFLGVMDQSIVATAGPTIISDLGGLNLYAWVFSAFILAQSISLLILGRLSDIYGRKRLFLAGVLIFLGGSLLSGQARSIEQLIIFRALQGVGSGAFFSIGLAITGAVVNPTQRARVLGLAGGILGAGAILGPTVGSYLVQTAGWRWVFYVNIPVGIMSLLLVGLWLKETGSTQTKQTVDWLGAAALTGWVSFLLLGLLSGGSTYPWYSWQEGALFAGFVILLPVFLIIESRVDVPILPLSLFKSRTISSAFIVQFMRGAVLLGVVAFISLLVQGALTGSINDTRNVIYTFVVPFVIASIASGQVVARLGYRLVTLVGMILVAIGSLLLAFIGPSPSLLGLMQSSAVLGTGLGVSIASVLSAFQNSVQRTQMGAVSSLSFFSLNLGGAIAVGVLGTIQVNSLGTRLSSIAQGAPPQYQTPLTGLFSNPNLIGRLLTSPAALAQLIAKYPWLTDFVSQIRGALGGSITDAYLLLVALAGIAIVASLFMAGSAKKTSSMDARSAEDSIPPSPPSLEIDTGLSQIR